MTVIVGPIARRRRRGRRCRGYRRSIVIRNRHRLNDEQLLNVLARAALAHAVPRGVGEDTAGGPHDGDGGFGASWKIC